MAKAKESLKKSTGHNDEQHVAATSISEADSTSEEHIEAEEELAVEPAAQQPNHVNSPSTASHIALIVTTTVLLATSAELSTLGNQYRLINPAAGSALAGLSTYALLGAVATSSIPIDRMMEGIPSFRLRRAITAASAAATGAAITFLPPGDALSAGIIFGGRVLTINTGFNDAVSGFNRFSRSITEAVGLRDGISPLVLQAVASQGLITLSAAAYSAAAVDEDPVEAVALNTAGTLALLGAITSSAPVVHRLTEPLGTAGRSVLAGVFSAATGIAMICAPEGLARGVSSSMARLGAINIGFEDTMKATRATASYIVEALGCRSRRRPTPEQPREVALVGRGGGTPAAPMSLEGAAAASITPSSPDLDRSGSLV
jgi:hypothetical protein